MIRVYIAAAIAALFLFVYVAGIQNGRAKCISQTTQNTTNLNDEIINKSEVINAEIIKTDTGNIRRILHEKYTIAD